MKAFISSQLSYGPFMWILHSKRLGKNKCITWEEFDNQIGRQNIQHKNLQALATEICNSERHFCIRGYPYNPRSSVCFKTRKIHWLYMSLVQYEVRQPVSLCDFEAKIKKWTPSSSALSFEKKIYIRKNYFEKYYPEKYTHPLNVYNKPKNRTQLKILRLTSLANASAIITHVSNMYLTFSEYFYFI